MFSTTGQSISVIAGTQFPAAAVQGLLRWVSYCSCSSSRLPNSILAAAEPGAQQLNFLTARQFSCLAGKNSANASPSPSGTDRVWSTWMLSRSLNVWKSESYHLGGLHSPICTRSLAQAAAAVAAKPPKDGAAAADSSPRSAADWAASSNDLDDFIAAEDPLSPPLSSAKTEFDSSRVTYRRGGSGTVGQDEVGPSQQHTHQHHHAQAPRPHHQRHQPHMHMQPPPPPQAASSRAAAEQLLSADEYRQQHSMRVQGMDPPDPVQSFSGVQFHPKIWSVLREAGFPAPTPIQAQAWPIAMAGRDMVGLASTGSGKTVAFLLPGFEQILKKQKDRQPQPQKSRGSSLARPTGPMAIVLAPTRELAQQIYEEARKFGRGVRITSAVVYGGASKNAQLAQIDRHPQVLVATPGRLLDFVESGDVDLRQVSYLVLDEADRMLDMGFEPQINKIVEQLPAQRQTLFFSATWPQEVQQIARRYVNEDPVIVFMGDVTSKPVASKSVTQIVKVVNRYDKPAELGNYLQKLGMNARVMVFCNTKRKCDSLELQINEAGLGVRAAALHGDKTQMARDRILNAFRSGRLQVLVATDVAARGLDVSGVTAVVNYDYPQETEMYVHRIGRTGRGGATGESLTLFTHDDQSFADELLEVLEGAEQEVPEEIRSMAAAERAKRLPQRRSRSYGGGNRGHHADRWGRGRDRDSRRESGDRYNRGGGYGERRWSDRGDGDWSRGERDGQRERGRRWDDARDYSRRESNHHHADRFRGRRNDSAKDDEFDY